MKMDKVAGSGNDEFYTPDYAITPIMKYLSTPPAVIWCPFDMEDSLFVKRFRDAGYTVIATHIRNGQDFFELDVPDCDYIISNPPYTQKGEVLNRLFEIGRPFAMLVGVVGLFESQKRFEMFRDHDFEIMYLNRRISYFKDYGEQKPSLNPPFSSVYVCSGILPCTIVFEEIEKVAKPARRVSPAERAWLNNINLQLAHEEIMQAKRELWLFERPKMIERDNEDGV